MHPLMHAHYMPLCISSMHPLPHTPPSSHTPFLTHALLARQVKAERAELAPLVELVGKEGDAPQVRQRDEQCSRENEHYMSTPASASTTNEI